MIDLFAQMLQNFIQFVFFNFKFLERLLDSNVLDVQSHQLIDEICFKKMSFVMLNHIINICLCKSVAKILMQSFHFHCIVCN